MPGEFRSPARKRVAYHGFKGLTESALSRR